MRLALNMVSLHGGGGGRIAETFLTWLLRETAHGGVVALPDGALPPVLAAHPGRFAVHAGAAGRYAFAGRLYFDNVRWPERMRAAGADVLFSLINLSTLRPAVPHLVLYHQAHYVYPDSPAFARMSARERARQSIQRGLFRETLRGAAGVVVQTSVMRDRLLHCHGDVLRDAPVHVLPNSAFPLAGVTAEAAWRTPSAAETLSRAGEAAPRRWLAPTQYYPHKGLESLLAAARVLVRRGVRDVRIALTVGPGDHPGAPAFLAAARAPDVAPALELLGRQPAAAMPALYAGATGVVHPADLEAQSFGYLEAMAFGRALVAVDRDFARVVCRDAAAYVPPYDPEALADTLVHLSRDDAAREALASRGRARSVECEAEAAPTFSRYVDLLGDLARTRVS